MRRRLVLLLLAGAAASPAPPAPPLAAQTRAPAVECRLCHADLEFLRQRSPTLEAARSLLVVPGRFADSAHGDLACAECHAGYGAFPHPARGPRTTPCAECHEPAHRAWSAGVHASPDEAAGARASPDETPDAAPGAPAASCSACHGVHDVLPVDGLAEDRGRARMNASCLACHETAAPAPADPHRTTTSCAACHGAHETVVAADAASPLAPANQPATCGACHEDAAAAAGRDVHGTGVARWAGADPGSPLGPGDEKPPTCTSCHGTHDMRGATDPDFARDLIWSCAGCHEYHGDSYLYTYHGKATRLGSGVSATCADCHTAHDVRPASDPASAVAEANLVETCAACHPYARPAFVRYDAHPNPFDRARNPWIFYSFWFMNILLVSVLGVFGLHTFLWWVRLELDRRRGIVHGVGVHEEGD